MTILDTSEHGSPGIPIHYDELDLFTALLHLGNASNGGSTKYFDGNTVSNIGNVTKTIDFQHGRIQIGFFNQVLHSADKWEGKRITINSNIKNNVFDFFKKYGMQYYHQYEEQNYPTKFVYK